MDMNWNDKEHDVILEPSAFPLSRVGTHHCKQLKLIWSLDLAG